MESLNWLWSNRKDILRVAVLAAVGLTAVYTSIPRYAFHERSVANSHTSGLIGDADGQTSLGERGSGMFSKNHMLAGFIPAAPEGDASRKVAYTSGFDLIVTKPSEAAEKIRRLTGRLGGYLVTSQVSGTDTGFASLTIRIPVAHAEEAKAEIRKLAIRVESEKTEAEDVTKQWVDTDAHLRNLRATEQQYLQILKRATSVSDTVEVTDKLGEVRGEIEQQQAEFAALTKRVETVTISVQFQPDADVQVFGLHWRPLYRAKLSLREAVDAIGDYSATVFEIIMHIPVILLWLVTLVAFAAIGWRLLRWIGRVFFGWKTQPKA
jgi:hypothetical protein